MGGVGRVVGVVLLLGLMAVGCGNDGSNDQGISFRAVGIFTGDATEQKCTAPTTDKAIADQSIALRLANPLIDTGFPNDSSAFFLCRGYIWLQNDLFNQAVVVDRIDFEYEIPGARISIPSSSSVVGFRINPANADPDKNPSPFGQVNVYLGHLQGQLVPSRLIFFLRQNQPSLPALPYVMIVHITARGRTDSGETVVSNEIRYTVEWTR